MVYQRSYPDGYSIPENYSGIAVEECTSYPEECEEVEIHSTPRRECEEETPCACREKKRFPLWEKATSLFSRLPFHLPRFEGDDFLILGVAVLLFFSRDGDKECALLLLLLLFIG